MQKQFELLEVRVFGGSSYRDYTVLSIQNCYRKPIKQCLLHIRLNIRYFELSTPLEPFETS